MNIRAYVAVIPISLVSLVVTTTAQAAFWQTDFLGSQVLSDGTTTVDVFNLSVQFDNNARVLNIFSANLVTASNFYQYTAAPFNPPNDTTAPNSGFITFASDLQWDSYVTIGDTDGADGTDTAADPDFVMGANTITGGWFDTNPTTPDGLSDASFRVFVARITLLTGGVRAIFPISGTAMVTYENSAGQLVQELVTNIPTPGTGLALLAGVGMASRRRRDVLG
jgi:hypothetical protein